MAGEQTGVVDHGGCGANGGKPAAGGVVGKHGGTHTRVGPQEFHAGAAGKEEKVEEPVADRGERGVGMKGDAIATGDMNGLAQGGDGHLNAGAAQQIDRGDGFQLFEAFRQECEDDGHVAK